MRRAGWPGATILPDERAAEARTNGRKAVRITLSAQAHGGLNLHAGASIRETRQKALQVVGILVGAIAKSSGTILRSPRAAAPDTGCADSRRTPAHPAA